MSSTVVSAADALKLLLVKSTADAERKLLQHFFIEVRKFTPGTVERWLSGRQFPNGEKLVALATFLTMRGFTVREFEQIPERYRTLAKAVSLGLLSSQVLASKLGFDDVSDIWRAFRGRGMGKQREEIVQALAEEDAAEVDRLWQVYSASLPGNVSAGQVAGHLRVAVVQSLARMMNGMLPLVQLVNGDEFTDADRQELRDAAGSSTVFDLSNALNDLCSDRSREIAKRGGSNGR